MLVEFGKFTGLHWNDTFSMAPFVCEALRNYMNPAPAAQEQAVAPSESGYQWKEVFLPEGTRLRASFDRKQYFAVVAGTEIKYGEHAISPSCFANLFGCGNRNAWKAVWLRLPGSTEWLLADVCRSARKAAIARLMTGAADKDGQPSPAAQPAPSSPTTPQDKRKQPAEQPPSRLTSAAPRPAERQPAPRAAHGNEVARKKSAGRNARRKRRAARLAATG
nr:hypothetical protein [Duganella aceris]